MLHRAKPWPGGRFTEDSEGSRTGQTCTEWQLARHSSLLPFSLLRRSQLKTTSSKSNCTLSNPKEKKKIALPVSADELHMFAFTLELRLKCFLLFIQDYSTKFPYVESTLVVSGQPCVVGWKILEPLYREVLLNMQIKHLSSMTQHLKHLHLNPLWREEFTSR